MTRIPLASHAPDSPGAFAEPDDRPGRVPLRGIGIAAALFLLFYLALPSRNHVYADDSLPYALYVLTGSLYTQSGDAAINVHHLALAPLHAASRLLGFEGLGDFPASQALFRAYVAISAALGLLLVGVLSARWFGSARVGLLAMAATAATYGYWSYAITTDLYVPGVAFVLLAVFLAEASYGSARPAPYLVGAALAVLAAAMNHQAYAFAAIPIGATLALHSGSAGRANRAAPRDAIPGRGRAARALLFAGAAALLGLAVFWIAYRASGSRDGFVRFAEGYGGWMKLLPTDKALRLETPVYAAVGIARALVFTDYALRFDALEGKIARAFPFKQVFDDRFLTHGIPQPIVVGLLALLAIVVAALAAGAVIAAVSLARGGRRPAGFVMLAGWAVLQVAFFSWWEPTSNEFWVWLLPCAAALGAGLAVGEPPRPRRLRIAGFVALALALVNAPAVTAYWSRANCVYAINKEYLDAVGADDLVVTSETFAVLGDVDPVERGLPPREAPPRVVYPWGAFRFDDPRLRAGLDRVRRSGGTVFIDPTLAMPDRSELSLASYFEGKSAEELGGEFHRLEEACRAEGIPLAPVRRRGEGARFLPMAFAGHAVWRDGAGAGGS